MLFFTNKNKWIVKAFGVTTEKLNQGEKKKTLRIKQCEYTMFLNGVFVYFLLQGQLDLNDADRMPWLQKHFCPMVPFVE